MRTNFYVAVYVWKWICCTVRVPQKYVLPRTIDEYPEEYLMYSPLFSRRVSRGMLIAFWTIVGYHVGMRFSVGHVLPYIGNNFVRFQLAAIATILSLFYYLVFEFEWKHKNQYLALISRAWYIDFFFLEFKWKKEKLIIKFCLQNKVSKYHHKLHEI